jgi:hypothetical protein
LKFVGVLGGLVDWGVGVTVLELDVVAEASEEGALIPPELMA